MNQNPENSPDTTNGKPPQWLILAAFAAVYLIWGSTYLAIRIAVETIPPFLMAGTRFLAAGVVLYAIMRLRGEPAPRPIQWRDATVMGALLLLLQNAVLTWVEQKTPSALAALIVGATPFWMILLNRIVYGARLTMPLVAGLVLGFAGVSEIVLGRDRDGKILVDSLHAGLLVAASVCWAAGTIYSRRARVPGNALQATAMQMVAGGLLALTAGVVSGEPASLHLSGVSRASWLALAYLCVFGSLVGYSAYVWLLRVSTIARVSTSAFVNPLVAVVLGSTLAHEPISPGIILAGTLIIGAVMLITWSRSARAVKRKPAVIIDAVEEAAG